MKIGSPFFSLQTGAISEKQPTKEFSKSIKFLSKQSTFQSPLNERLATLKQALQLVNTEIADGANSRWLLDLASDLEALRERVTPPKRC